MYLQNSNQLQIAIELFHQGKFGEAESILKKLLLIQGRNFDALHILGIIYGMQDRFELAAENLKKALRIDPQNSAAHTNLGRAYAGLGLDEKALTHLRQATSLAPLSLDAWIQLGQSLYKVGKRSEALDCLKKAVELDRSNPEAWANLGLLFSELGQHDEALAALNQCLQIAPTMVAAWSNKAVALTRLNQSEAAIDAAQKAISLQPNFAEAWLNKGVALNQLKKISQALEAFNQAISLDPQYAQAWSNKGSALNSLKQHNLALEAVEMATKLNPNDPDAWSNMGVVLQALRKFSSALVAFDRALQLRPDFHQALSYKGGTMATLRRFPHALKAAHGALEIRPDYSEGWSNLSNVLILMKRYPEALQAAESAVQLDPEYADAWHNKAAALKELKRTDEAIHDLEKARALGCEAKLLYSHLVDAKLKIADWSELPELINQLADGVDTGRAMVAPFTFLAMVDEPYLHLKAARAFTDEVNVQKLAPLPKALPQSSKIRIGYFSADFKTHPVAQLLAELFEIHDRAKFEVYAFSFGAAEANDPLRVRLQAAFDKFIDVTDLSDEQVVQMAREIGIQIAIDLGGHTGDSRIGIFALRAAPVQVSYLGYPGTQGADFIDFIIADHTLIPVQDQQYYTEKVVYMPYTYMVDDSKRIISNKPMSRVDFGLPADGFVYCCFNNSYKINSTIFDSWTRILQAVPGSVLWLSENSESFRNNLHMEAKKRGIDPQRIIYAPRMPDPSEHLARHRLADLFLDTTPYNAHTTAIDSLRAGLPVLTCSGKAFAGRVAASLLKAIELPQLITAGLEEYEALAVELAREPEKLNELRNSLAANSSTAPLFNTGLFVKNFESALLTLI